MELKITDYKTADLAYEAGFPQRTNECYVNDWFCPNYNHVFPEGHTTENIISAPTQELLRKWLRDKYNIEIEITRTKDTNEVEYQFAIYHFIKSSPTVEHTVDFRNSYEQALEAGLKEALKYLLNKND